MKLFTKGNFLKIGLEMIVLLRRNKVKRFEKHDAWNPDPGKNPYKTIAVFNKVTVWIHPAVWADRKVKPWLKVFVRTWDPKNGRKIPLKPKISNGNLIFQARTRIEIQVVDDKNSEKKELLAHYTADNNGTLRPELISNSEKIRNKEKPLSMNVKIPTKSEPVLIAPAESMNDQKNRKQKKEKITNETTTKSKRRGKKDRTTNNEFLNEFLREREVEA